MLLIDHIAGCLRGIRQALYEGRRHKAELRRHFRLVERNGWGTLASDVPVRLQTCGPVEKPRTLTIAAEEFIGTTSSKTLPAAQALSVLLRHVRQAVQTDVALVAEFVDGQQVCRAFDGLETSTAAIVSGMAVSSTAVLCQRAGGRWTLRC